MSKAAVQSPNLNFRELDDEDLQKRAKEWFQAVVGDVFEDQGLADALADGDILYRVAKVFKEMLYNSGSISRTPSRSSSETDLESKKSGKYLPYSNVDSFLKICKILNLPDIDLFTPPDVVEKKDIRRVCLCIRALSKKARTNQMRIPDFDNVAGTLETVPYDDGIDPVEWARNNSSIKDSLFSPWNASSFEAFLRESGSPPSRQATTPISYREGSPTFFPAASREASKDNLHTSSSHQESDGYPPCIKAVNGQYVHDLASGPFVRSTDDPLPLKGDSPNDLEPYSSTSKNFDKQCQGRDLNGTTNSKGEAKNARKISLWLTILAGAVTLVGVILARRPRDMDIYEVKPGDTLSDISRKTGKTGWQKLAELNPDIKDPNLIYPNERLKLYR